MAWLFRRDTWNDRELLSDRAERPVMCHDRELWKFCAELRLSSCLPAPQARISGNSHGWVRTYGPVAKHITH